jgi:hypothetical protein
VATCCAEHSFVNGWRHEQASAETSSGGASKDSPLLPC